MFIPYAVDVPFDRRPVVNYLVALGLLLVFGLQTAGALSPAARNVTDRLVLDGWTVAGLFGHMWIHAGPFHLIGNLIFLWLFGNAVCSKIGNLYYPPAYIFLGVLAGICHLVFSEGSAAGASGAINGIVGMYLVFFPENAVSCFTLIVYYPVFFSVRSFWIILLWFAFDLWGLWAGDGSRVGYTAHVGGFLAGFALAVTMLKTKLVTMERDEKSLLQLVGLDRDSGPPEQVQETRGDFAYWQQKWEEPQAGPTENVAAGDEDEGSELMGEESLRFKCFCGRTVKAPVEYAGRVGRCPQCGKRVKIPRRMPSQSEQGDMRQGT